MFSTTSRLGRASLAATRAPKASFSACSSRRRRSSAKARRPSPTSLARWSSCRRPRTRLSSTTRSTTGVPTTRHLLKLLTQAFQGELPSDAARPLDPVSDLTGEPLRLTDHPAGRGEQSAVALPKPRLALRSLGACRPRNIEHAQFDAPAAVAKPRADLAGDGGDLLHRPDQHPYAVPEQA